MKLKDLIEKLQGRHIIELREGSEFLCDTDNYSKIIHSFMDRNILEISVTTAPMLVEMFKTSKIIIVLEEEN